MRIPDEFAQRIKAAGGDPLRRALEALALDEYKLGHLTTAELRSLLGLGTEAEMESFLKAHGVSEAATPEDRRQDLARAAAQGIRELSRGVTLSGLKIKDLRVPGPE